MPRSSLRIIARVHSPIARANLESFRKNELINPFEVFAHNLGLDARARRKSASSNGPFHAVVNVGDRHAFGGFYQFF